MPLDVITILSEPRPSGEIVNGEWRQTGFSFEKYEPLLRDLRESTTVPVVVAYRALADAPAAGAVIWDPWAHIRSQVEACPAELRSRLVVNTRMNEKDVSVRELLEDFGVAGVVSGLDYYRKH